MLYGFTELPFSFHWCARINPDAVTFSFIVLHFVHTRSLSTAVVVSFRCPFRFNRLISQRHTSNVEVVSSILAASIHLHFLFVRHRGPQVVVKLPWSNFWWDWKIGADI
jgi:hypothetical protein